MATNFRQFDQHGQIDARDHFNIASRHSGDRQIGRRATEHIRKHDNARTVIDRVGRRDDIVATSFGIIVRLDANRRQLILMSNHMFERRDEFYREAPMGYNYEADHCDELSPNTAPQHAGTLLCQKQDSYAADLSAHAGSDAGSDDSVPRRLTSYQGTLPLWMNGLAVKAPSRRLVGRQS